MKQIAQDFLAFVALVAAIFGAVVSITPMIGAYLG